MSSAALDAPPFLYGQQGDTPSPNVYTITSKGAVQPTASTATFDGTGAGGPFLACLSFFAQSGELLSRVFPQTVVQAGDVAQVSYAPFPGGLATASGVTDAVRFNVTPQPAPSSPGLLQTDTVDGTTFNDNSNNGMSMNEAGSGGLQRVDSGGGGILDQTNATYQLHAPGDGTDGTSKLEMLTSAGSDIYLGNNTAFLDQNADSGTTLQGPVDVTMRAGGTAFIEANTNVEVVALGGGFVNIQSVTGQVSILTAPGNHPIGLDGGYPIIRNANSGGGVGSPTIQDRLDTGDFYAVINLAASATYFQVGQNGRVSMPHLPTSTAGLASGDLWNNAGVVNIV